MEAVRTKGWTAIFPLALLALTAAVSAPAAQAEIPSVDAYGGEALVLGRPHHGGGTGGGNGGEAAGRSTPGAAHGGATGASATGGGSGKGIGGAGNGTTGGTSNGTTGHGGAATATGPSRVGGSNGSGSSATSGKKTGAGGSGASPGRTGGAPTSVVDPYPNGSAGKTANALGGGEIALILLGLTAIAAIGWTLHGARQGAH